MSKCIVFFYNESEWNGDIQSSTFIYFFKIWNINYLAQFTTNYNSKLFIL